MTFRELTDDPLRCGQRPDVSMGNIIPYCMDGPSSLCAPRPPNPQCLLLSWLREEVLSDMFFCLVVLLLLILKCGPYTDLV